MQVWSYRFSTGEHVMRPSALLFKAALVSRSWTVPHSGQVHADCQIKRVKNMAADRTAFRTGIPLVDGHHRSPIPGSFVLQLAYQFAPADIRDRFRQAVILQPVFDTQRLNTDHLVLVNQASRQFVQQITASISNASRESATFRRAFSRFLDRFCFLAWRRCGAGASRLW